MNSAHSFSASYAEARGKFLAAAEKAKGDIHAHKHPLKDPDGKEIATDVAWFGPANASRVLVMISATHGIEGFCGSGAQIDWLAREEQERLPSGTAVMMIHAINPYGFAWQRRVTEDNVDLNRNWIDFGATVPANPKYDELDELLCPSDWSDGAQQSTSTKLMEWIGRNGMPAFQQAVSGGQYKHSRGLFFGGTKPTWSRNMQTEIFRSRLSSAERVAIIDYHTGLGPWGYGGQIAPVAQNTEDFARARDWFGAAVTSPSGGTSTSADIAGDGLSAAPQILPHAEVTGIALEVGTVSLIEVLQALRADAWLHAHGDVRSPQGQAIKKQIRAAFYGEADDWKGMVAGQSLLACRQALAGLQR